MQPVAIRFSDAHRPISRAVEFVGATTLAQSLWRVAAGDAVVARVRLLPAQPSAGVERRQLAEQLRERIGAALDAP